MGDNAPHFHHSGTFFQKSYLQGRLQHIHWYGATWHGAKPNDRRDSEQSKPNLDRSIIQEHARRDDFFDGSRDAASTAKE